MKLIKLWPDHYVVMENRKEIASTKPEKGVLALDLFEVRQLVSNVSRIPEDLKSPFEILGQSVAQEVTKVYTIAYNNAEYANRDKKYTKEDLFEILLDFIEFQHPHEEPRGLTVSRFLETVEPRLSWNVEFVEGKLKLK